MRWPFPVLQLHHESLEATLRTSGGDTALLTLAVELAECKEVGRLDVHVVLLALVESIFVSAHSAFVMACAVVHGLSTGDPILCPAVTLGENDSLFLGGAQVSDLHTEAAQVGVRMFRDLIVGVHADGGLIGLISEQIAGVRLPAALYLATERLTLKGVEMVVRAVRKNPAIMGRSSLRRLIVAVPQFPLNLVPLPTPEPMSHGQKTQCAGDGGDALDDERDAGFARAGVAESLGYDATFVYVIMSITQS